MKAKRVELTRKQAEALLVSVATAISLAKPPKKVFKQIAAAVAAIDEVFDFGVTRTEVR